MEKINYKEILGEHFIDKNTTDKSKIIKSINFIINFHSNLKPKRRYSNQITFRGKKYEMLDENYFVEQFSGQFYMHIIYIPETKEKKIIVKRNTYNHELSELSERWGVPNLYKIYDSCLNQLILQLIALRIYKYGESFIKPIMETPHQYIIQQSSTNYCINTNVCYDKDSQRIYWEKISFKHKNFGWEKVNETCSSSNGIISCAKCVQRYLKSRQLLTLEEFQKQVDETNANFLQEYQKKSDEIFSFIKSF